MFAPWSIHQQWPYMHIEEYRVAVIETWWSFLRCKRKSDFISFQSNCIKAIRSYYGWNFRNHKDTLQIMRFDPSYLWYQSNWEMTLFQCDRFQRLYSMTSLFIGTRYGCYLRLGETSCVCWRLVDDSLQFCLHILQVLRNRSCNLALIWLLLEESHGRMSRIFKWRLTQNSEQNLFEDNFSLHEYLS